ncbi:MAG: hypothetical protein IJP45_03065 [Paludibacteraceae bacterium]|nr:hypothetical protein [Paludibacteraceae bacterium]
MKTTRLIFFAVMAMLFAACNSNAPTKAYEGVWEPVNNGGVERGDLFVVTSDSIKGILGGGDAPIIYYRCHYKVLRDSVVELERCWMADFAGAEESMTSETYMYINNQGYLIIKDFDPLMQLVQVVPNYASLTLKRHKENLDNNNR